MSLTFPGDIPLLRKSGQELKHTQNLEAKAGCGGVLPVAYYSWRALFTSL